MSEAERIASALRGIVARASRDQQGAGSFDVLAERVLAAIRAAAERERNVLLFPEGEDLPPYHWHVGVFDAALKALEAPHA